MLDIAALKPRIIATGHGKPMSGPEMEAALHNLSRHFDEVARPKKGRYKDEAAVVDASGVMYVPPREKSALPWLLLSVGVTVVAAVVTVAVLSRRREPEEKSFWDYLALNK